MRIQGVLPYRLRSSLFRGRRGQRQRQDVEAQEEPGGDHDCKVMTKLVRMLRCEIRKVGQDDVRVSPYRRHGVLPYEVSETPNLFEDQIPHPADGIFFFKRKVKWDFAKWFVGGIVPYRETKNHCKPSANKGMETYYGCSRASSQPYLLAGSNVNSLLNKSNAKGDALGYNVSNLTRGLMGRLLM